MRRAHVWPPSKETPTARPATTSGSVDIATTFDGLAGLTAIASSASFPGMAVTLRLGGGTAPVARVAVARAPAAASMIVEDVLVRNRPHMLSPPSRGSVRARSYAGAGPKINRLTVSNTAWYQAEQSSCYDAAAASFGR